MKISKTAIKCTRMYMKKVKIPKCFTFEDVTCFKLYLAYRFSFELDNVKRANFTQKENLIYGYLLVYKKFIDEKMFKNIVFYTLAQKGSKNLEKEKRKIIKLLKKYK